MVSIAWSMLCVEPATVSQCAEMLLLVCIVSATIGQCAEMLPC